MRCVLGKNTRDVGSDVFPFGHSRRRRVLAFCECAGVCTTLIQLRCSQYFLVARTHSECIGLCVVHTRDGSHVTHRHKCARHHHDSGTLTLAHSDTTFALTLCEPDSSSTAENVDWRMGHAYG